MRPRFAGILLAVAALLVCTPVASAAGADGALMETVIKGLDDRDAALREFHALMLCRSWITDAHVEALGKHLLEPDVAGPPRPLQNRALYMLDIYYRGDQWAMDAAMMVSDGAGGLFGFLSTPTAGITYRDIETPGMGCAVVRMSCDGKQVVCWEPAVSRAEIWRLREPRQGRSKINLPLSEMLLWLPGGPAGEVLRRSPPDFIEGPIERDGHQCYRLVAAADAAEDVGPWRREVWVAPDLGYAVVATSKVFLQRGTTDSGGRLDVRATQWKKVVPGLWFPTETVVDYFGYGTGFDPPWRYTRVYQVHRLRADNQNWERAEVVEVGPGTASGDPPFGLRLPLGTHVRFQDPSQRSFWGDIVGVGSSSHLEEREFLDRFHEWSPPPVDERHNRPLVQTEIDALMADVAHAQAARAGKQVD